MARRKRAANDLVVIGGGIAGLMAAAHACRHGLKVHLIEQDLLLGGQVANVEAVDGLPAIGETSGTVLAVSLMEAVTAAGGSILHEPAQALEAGDGGICIRTEGGAHETDAAIIATGARLRRLGVPGEEALTGRGVSQCAACDGGFFRGEDVVVVGGGDAALQEALVLAPICRSVTLVTRNALRAKRAYVERITAHENVRFVWSSTVEAVLGEDGVRGVRIRNGETGESEERACAGVFPFIGSDPNTGWLPQHFPRDAGGGIITHGLAVEGAPGIYAIGAVRSGYNGQIASAAGEAVAAVEAIVRARQG